MCACHDGIQREEWPRVGSLFDRARVRLGQIPKEYCNTDIAVRPKEPRVEPRQGPTGPVLVEVSAQAIAAGTIMLESTSRILSLDSYESGEATIPLKVSCRDIVVRSRRPFEPNVGAR